MARIRYRRAQPAMGGAEIIAALFLMGAAAFAMFAPLLGALLSHPA